MKRYWSWRCLKDMARRCDYLVERKHVKGIGQAEYDDLGEWFYYRINKNELDPRKSREVPPLLSVIPREKKWNLQSIEIKSF